MHAWTQATLAKVALKHLATQALVWLMHACYKSACNGQGYHQTVADAQSVCCCAVYAHSACTGTTCTQQPDAHADQTQNFDNLLQVFIQITVWL